MLTLTASQGCIDKKCLKMYANLKLNTRNYHGNKNLCNQ